MRVVYNGIALRPPKTGVGYYTERLAQALHESCPEWEVTFFDSRAFRSALHIDPARPVHRQPSSLDRLPPFITQLWKDTLFFFFCWARGFDLYHETNFIPMRCPCPTVITVHDLSFRRFPAAAHPQRLRHLNTYFQKRLRWAHRVIVDSEFVKREVIEELQLPPDRVDVVYLGVDGRFYPKPPEEVLAFKKAAGLPERYILYVGAIEPRKNLPLLLRAFHRARASLPPDLMLVLAGPLGWQHEEVIRTRERLDLKNRVLLPGYTPEEKLPLLYGGAELFVYPSLYEGFGLPPLEAMACGTPVIASRAGALPEVVGDAGLLISPIDEEGWANAMQEVLGSRGLKAALQEKGFSRVRLFSWENAAAATLRSYRLVYEDKRL